MKNKIRIAIRVIGILSAAAGIAMLIVATYLECRFWGKQEPFLPPAGRMLAPGKTDFKVAVFGDFAMQSDVFVPVLKDISASPRDFAVSVGDMFRYPARGEGDYLCELLRENLSIPLYAIPGNHDRVRDSFAAYRRSFGQESYFFGYGDTLFIMLNDVNRIRLEKSCFCISDEDILFLENVLAHYRRDFRRCVLFTHVPPDAPDAGKEYLEWNPISEQLAQILRRYPVDAIVCGHLHLDGETIFEGVPVYIVPCSGQTQRDTVHPDFGYLELHFKADGTVGKKSCFVPDLERGRNYFLGYLVAEVPGDFRYLYAALALLVCGFVMIFAARKK